MIGPLVNLPVSIPLGSSIMADKVRKLAMPETTDPSLNLYFSIDGQL